MTRKKRHVFNAEGKNIFWVEYLLMPPSVASSEYYRHGKMEPKKKIVHFQWKMHKNSSWRYTIRSVRWYFSAFVQPECTDVCMYPIQRMNVSYTSIWCAVWMRSASKWEFIFQTRRESSRRKSHQQKKKMWNEKKKNEK